MNYYYYNQNNSDYPYISTPNNNSVKKENPFQKYLIERDLNKQKVLDNNISSDKEDNNQLKNKNENFGTGKFRFINTKAEKEDNINKSSEYTNDKNSYSTENINNKNNNSNKITNNICIIINKPEVKDINKNNNNNEYIDNYDEEEESNNNSKNNKKINKNDDEKFSSHKKNMTYGSSYTQTKKKSPNEYIEEIDKNNDYSYMDTEPNQQKITLHKKLKQKKQKLRDLERSIEIKENSLKEKKSKVNIKEKKVVRSTTFDRGALTNKKLNDLKGESVTYDSPNYYTIEKKKKSNNNYKNIKNNINTNLQNKFANSENQIFRDIPVINIQKQKLYDDEEDNVYNTMSPDATRDKFNISFNQSIEQKRRILGIPLYKNAFQKYNKKRINTIKKKEPINTEDKEKGNIDKEQKKNLGKITMYKRRQDEILRNYEKKNILNQRSRDYIRSKKNKTPIRINYYDKQKKGISYNNIFDNDNNINNVNNNKQKDKNEFKTNKSYVARHSKFKNKNKENAKNQKDIPNHNKSNKTHNSINHKDEENNYFKNKIKAYQQKEKPKENKTIKNYNDNNNNYIRKEIKRNSQDLNELNPFLSNNNEPPLDTKIYENKTYYTKIISKLFNYEFESQKKSSKKPSNNNSDNKSINNYNNTLYTNNKKSNLNINNYKNVSPYRSKLLYASPRHREIMTIHDNENGKVLRVVKKRHKSPIKKTIETQQPKKSKFIEIKKPEQKKETQENTLPKKDYKNNVIAPGRGILTLRRINQRIENYKKNIHLSSKKRKKTKSKNPQYKSLSQLKKIEKHPFGKIRQNKSIKTLPDVNKGPYKNFDFINDL